MSSILSGFDSSNIPQNNCLLDFDDNHDLGDLVSEDVARQVIDLLGGKFRKGDFVLVKNIHQGNYTYAIFEGNAEEDGFCFYGTGEEKMEVAEKSAVFKIKNYKTGGEPPQDDAIEFESTKDEQRSVHWFDRKNIRLVEGSKVSLNVEIPVQESTYKLLLRKHAFDKDVSKFLKIRIIDDIIKHHHFTNELAMMAFRIRVLHDDELIKEFDKAITKLEQLEEQYEKTSNTTKKKHTFERCQSAKTTLKLFLGEIIKRGLD